MAISKKKPDIISGVRALLNEFGISQRSKILIGVSGGIDSMVLCEILVRLQKEGVFLDLAIAHLNHNLRAKDSDEDALFVKNYAERMGLILFEKSVDITTAANEHKKGIEETARDQRYGFFLDCAKEFGFDFVATAHTADDQLETLLMNIVRGSGLKGLYGIPTNRKLDEKTTVIRPLLRYSREKITIFAEENNIQWREDASNQSMDYTRNRIRTLVIPAIRESYRDRNIYAGVTTTTENIASLSRLFEDQLTVFRTKVPIAVDKFFIEPTYFEINILKLKPKDAIFLAELIGLEIGKKVGKEYPLDSLKRKKIQELLINIEAKRVQLSDSIFGSRSKDNTAIRIELIHPIAPIKKELLLGEDVETSIGTIKMTKEKKISVNDSADIAYIPASFVHTHRLLLRNWQPSDRMRPFGFDGTRMVSDILSEAGLKTEHTKENYPVLTAMDDPTLIVWLPGIRCGEHCRVSENETAYKLSRKR